jgi:uncharacterized membrane protein
VHLAYRVELMRLNGIVMQALMGATLGTAALFTIVSRGWARVFAAAGAVLGLVTFLVTRFGNVPINAEIRAWAAGDLAPDHLDRLRVWGLFHDIRVTTAVGAFALLIVAAGLTRQRVARESQPPVAAHHGG